MFKKTLLAALLATVSIGAFAQSPAPAPTKTTSAPKTSSAPASTAEQKAQIEKQNAQMAQASLRIAQMIDQGQTGKVWDQSSSVARQISKRADFVQQITADRAKLGTPSSRKLMAVTRTHSTGGKVPAGLYINASYATQFANARQPVRELVSFHWDSDHVWRLAGYTVR